jgi:outer membrane protein TolC
MKKYPLIGCILLLTGCASYHAKPLPSAEPTFPPNTAQLQRQIKQLQHPLLKPLSFDLRDGLSPDEAAVLAVVHNPELRAARSHRGIAEAQLLQAGILPNPRLAYNAAAPSGGLDKDKVTGFGLNLDWEITALLSRSAKIAAASADQQAIELRVAWQEWQVAQAAKTAVYQVWTYQQQVALLLAAQQRLADNSNRLAQAAALGLVTEIEQVTARTAQDTIALRLQQLAEQQQRQQQRLNRALGFAPHTVVPLATPLSLSNPPALPTESQLNQNVVQRRLDLRALQQAYQSQEQQLHSAVLQQFPKISLGFTQSKNNSDYYTLGAGVSVSLPVFDQNQGAIAVASATREQLLSEYQNRLFQTKADIAELCSTLRALTQQIETVQHFLPTLDDLVHAYQVAREQGQIDNASYYAALNNATDKRVELLTLQLRFVEARIALEIATGCYQLPAA